MKVNWFTILIVITTVLLPQIQCRVVRKKITLGQLSNQRTIFITRFDFGTGQGNITIKYRKLGVQNVQLTNIKVGLLLDQNYEEFNRAKTCSEKQKIYTQSHRVKFYDALLGTQIVRVNQNIREHLWYVFIYNCQDIELRSRDGAQGVFFDFTFLNNGSHFGEDQGLLWPYIVLMAIWLLILVKKLFMPMFRAFLKVKTQPLQTFLYTGYLLISLSIFYRLLNLFMVYYSGQSLSFFNILHGSLKNISQGIILIILISISWGWSITHMHFKTRYKIIAMGVVGVNVGNLVLWHLKEEIEDSYHQYEDATGVAVFLMRVLLGVGFVVGCVTSSAASVGKRKHFMDNFMKIGSVYLFSWPVAVVICQLLLPKYLHNEYGHVLANAYICWLFAYPDSDYKKVNIKKSDDEILPEYSPH